MRRTGAWIVAAVISVGCGAPAAPTSPAPVVNASAPLTPPTGRVLEYGTLAPISGAVVSFFSFDLAPPIASVGTDATGGYRVDLAPGTYRVAVDDVPVAVLTVRPGTPHGDIIARAGNCSVTYGFVTDAATGAPLAGAVVSLTGRRATTSSRGWYLIDFGCDLPIGGNTTFIDFTREGYTRQTPIYGRGVRGTRRFDAALAPE
jgi:hypothetical protein